jgi:hydrogenase expression/formation protein HypE
VKKIEEIKLEHGSGGALSRQLIDDLIFPLMKSGKYTELSDATSFRLEGEGFITTDSYVIDPLRFPGGDIGTLAVFGTCNDLSVAGAVPRYLSLSLILEEGLPLKTLKEILESAVRSAGEAKVAVVTGDTKVVPKGRGGGMYINTTGLGERVFQHPITPQRISPRDAVLVSGPVGSHGIAVLAAREKLSVGSSLRSDCAFLHPLCRRLFDFGEEVKFIRDATRGGAAAILNEICRNMPFGITAHEAEFPVEEEVSTVADLLGLNPLEVANEGVIIAVVSQRAAEKACRALRSNPLGKKAAVVGEITQSHPGQVILETRIGGRRVMDFPRGLLLPRIC